MSRYRQPVPRSSPYITPQGYDVLKLELKSLWQKRAEVTRALTAAAAEGDRSENAEYIYRKKQLGEVDRRIRYLQKRLPELKVVREVADTSRVYFGATLTLEDEDGERRRYRIVGADEIDSDQHRGHISLDSPLAKALLKKSVDDEVTVTIGNRKNSYTILSIHYEQ